MHTQTLALRATAVVAGLSLAGVTTAQASIIKDVNAVPLQASSSPGYIGQAPYSPVQLGTNYLFRARTDATGTELFITDGTTAGTKLVKDIYPGTGSSSPSNAIVIGGKAYFTAFVSGVTGRELWVTDGTTAGTQLVKDIRTGTSSSSPNYLTPIGGGKFVFRASDATNGTELWVSDGTTAGTTVIDIYPGTGSSSPSYLTAMGGKVYFSARTSATGYELFETDGTAAGTKLVADIYPGTSSASPAYIWNNGGTLIFSAYDTNGRELWKSDGTAAGTTMIKDIRAGSGSSSPYPGNSLLPWPSVGTKFYFRASDSTTGSELWESDGTAAGTKLVQDIRPGTSSSSPTNFGVVGTKLYFSASGVVGSTSTGYEPHVLDTTTGTVTMLGDLYAGTSSSSPNNFLFAATGVLFNAYTGTGTGGVGREWFVTNGTVAGTKLLVDFAPGTTSGVSQLLWANGPLIFFSGNDGKVGTEFCRTVGTASGTQVIANINPESGKTSSSSPSFQTIANGKLWFAANDGVNGTELWVSDGSSAGTKMVVDLNPGSASSSPRDIFPFGNGVLFAANDGTNGYELHFSDGTAAGTKLIKDIYAGSGSGYFDDPFRIGNKVLFEAYTAANGYELWSTDGTAAGTVLVKDIYAGSGSGYVNYPAVLGGALAVFRARTAANGYEPWVTDGTAAGTMMLKEIRGGSSSSSPSNFFAAGNRIYFSASDGTIGYELWSTNGTAAGTVLVKDINTGSSSSSPSQFAVVNGKVLFSAIGPSIGRELYETDGTAAGTVLVKDIYAGTSSSSPSLLTTVGKAVFFRAAGGGSTSNYELWKTDGTAAGTVLVKEIYAGTTGSYPYYFAQVGTSDLVVFRARETSTSNYEPWISDGTLAGTKLLGELYPGTGGSYPIEFHRLGSTMTFEAQDDKRGYEPWKFDLKDVGASLAAMFGTGCPGTGGLTPKLMPAGGQPVIGNAAFRLDLSDANKSSATALMFGTQTANLPIGGGCDLLVGGTLVTIGGVSTDAAGKATYAVAVPNDNSLVGLEGAFQTVVVDSNGAWLGLVTLSNGVEIVVGK